MAVLTPDHTENLPSPGGEPSAEQLPRRRRWTGWLRERIATTAVLTVLLALTAVVRLVNLTGAPQRLDDEGTYVAQAYAVTHLNALTHYTYWYDHPPLGWLQLAGWTWAAGDTIAAGRVFMVLLAVLSAALLWVLTRRLGLSVWTAAAAVTMLALSPLAVQFQRTVYLDNIATMWLLAAAVCFCTPRRRLAAYAGGAACLAIAVLSKETTLLLAPGLAWLAWRHTDPLTRRYAIGVATSVFGLLIGGYLLVAVFKGELLPGASHVSLLDGLRFQLWQRGSGGSVFSTGTANRHTLQTWLDLDPVVLLASVPAAVGCLFTPRLRPLAAGYLVYGVMLARTGYLPVPYVIAALPLAALLVAGAAEQGLRFFRARGRTPLSSRPLLVPALLGVLAVAVAAVPAWTPTLRYLATADADAPMRQAEHWVAQNVPLDQRIITDDAFWTDLVRAGRTRDDVVWFYKVDTDPEVQSWSPKGWQDYDWVIDTQAVRQTPSTGGQLDNAVRASVPVAVFGIGDQRVEVRKIDHTGTAEPNPAGARGESAGQVAGTRLAAHLSGTSDPAALALLRAGWADPRAIITMNALAGTTPLNLAGLPEIPGEDAAGWPRRQVLLTGADPVRIATFFRAQQGDFATDYVQLTADGVLVRFPPLPPRGVLDAAAKAVVPGTASLRVVDLLPTTGQVQPLLVGLDGTAVSPLPDHGQNTATAYSAVPAGVYTLVTRPAGAPADAPAVVRQTFVVQAGSGYSLLLFDGATQGRLNSQLTPDGAPGASTGTGWLRLANGASATSSLDVATADGFTGTTTLAHGIDYGLVTGFALVRAGVQHLTLTSPAGTWHVSVPMPNRGAVTLLLTDGADGPTVVALPESPWSPPQNAVDATVPVTAVPAAAPPTASTTGNGLIASLPTLILGVAVGAGAIAAEAVVRRRKATARTEERAS
jgi:4-amino-4-deoxy-L-arabinose transferase-like glycosyltransferase